MTSHCESSVLDGHTGNDSKGHQDAHLVKMSLGDYGRDQGVRQVEVKLRDIWQVVTHSLIPTPAQVEVQQLLKMAHMCPVVSSDDSSFQVQF